MMLIRTAVYYGDGPGFAIDLRPDCAEKIEAAFKTKDVPHLLAVAAVAVADKTGLWEIASTDLQLFTPMDADPVVLGGAGWIIHLFPNADIWRGTSFWDPLMSESGRQKEALTGVFSRPKNTA